MVKKLKSINQYIPLAIILFFIIAMGSGTYFDYDLLQGISTPIFSIYDIKASEMMFVYSSYGGINLFLAPVGGYLISTQGVARMSVYCSAVIYLGLFISYLSTVHQQFGLIEIGYLFVGLGNETLINTQVTALEKWFSGKFLSFSIGMKFTAFMLMGALSDYLCPEIYIHMRSIQGPIFLTGIVCFLGFLASFGYFLIEPSFELALKKNRKRNVSLLKGRQQKLSSRLESSDQSMSIVTDSGIQTPMKTRNSSISGAQEITEGALSPETFQTNPSHHPEINFPKNHKKSKSKKKRKNMIKGYQFKFSDVTKLGKLYWFIVPIYWILPQAYFRLIQILTDMSKVKYHYEYEEAKNFSATVKITCLILLPILSFTVGKIGKKSLLLCFSSIMALVSILNLYSIPSQPSYRFIASVIGIGAFYSVYLSCIWSSIAISLPKTAVGLGYGIASSGQMMVTTVIPRLLGYFIQERTEQAYENGLMVLIGANLIGIAFCLNLLIYDLRNGKVLHYKENSEEVLRYREWNDKRFRGELKSNKKSGNELAVLESSVDVGGDNGSESREKNSDEIIFLESAKKSQKKEGIRELHVKKFDFSQILVTDERKAGRKEDDFGLG